MENQLQLMDADGNKVLRREPEPPRDNPRADGRWGGDDFVAGIRDRFRLMKEADDVQRTRSVEEVEFNSGKHWEDEMRKEREDKDRVVIEINRTPQYLNQVANEQRLTRPSILVKPNGNGADEDNAQVKQGIVRSIERRSGAENIRDDSFYRMLEKGWTYYRVNVKFESEKSFRQVIRTGRFANDFAVYHDPAATEYDLSDAMDWIIMDDMPLDEYEQAFPGADVATMSDMQALGDEVKDWVGDGTVRVAEYWKKDRKREKLYMLADDPMGDGRWENELGQGDDGRLVGVAYIEDEPIYRWSWRERIMWAKVNAVQVLDGNEDKTGPREYLKGAKYVPIVPICGRKVLVKKRYIWTGMVRDAIEPCLASDYWLSAITEMVALGPKAPWVVCYESVAQYREMWDQSNIENYAALFYDKYDAEGNELPAPFRNFGEPPIQAMTFILNYAQEDLKRVMGIYNPSLGAPSNEVAGVAIKARQNESDIANFNYVDNLKRSMEHEARIYLDLMPKVMDARQAIEIIRPDGQAEKVLINQEFKGPDGKVKSFILGKGDYDVEVEIGASAATRREAAAQGILDYLKVDPQAAPLVGYLLARNLDFPDKAELEKVLKARAVQMGASVDNGSPTSSDVPPQFAAQYQQLSQKVEQLTQALQQAQQEIATEQAKYTSQREIEVMKAASAERREAQRGEVMVLVKELDSKSNATQAMLEAAIQQWQTTATQMAQEPAPQVFQFTPGVGLTPVPPGQPAAPQQGGGDVQPGAGQ